MPENIAISIIIPLYRAEKFIRECIESVLKQDFSQTYEVIVVDDCSDDESVAIVRELAVEAGQTIKLVSHKVNRGVSAARNTGLAEMKGEYFMFVDADDRLPREALVFFYDAARRYNADLVKGNIIILKSGTTKRTGYSVRKTELFEEAECFNQLLLHKKVRGHAGAKLFKSELFGDLRFPEGVSMTEDLRYCAQVFSKASRLVVLAKDVYEYRKHGASSTDEKYVNGTYMEWLETVDSLNDGITNSRHKKSYFIIKVKTLLQIVRESRSLEADLQVKILDILESRRTEWGVNILSCLVRMPGDFRSIYRYLRYRFILGNIIATAK